MILDLADFSSQHSDNPIQNHPEWQDGDFVLVSSDGWRFKAPSELLFRSSPILRKLYQPGHATTCAPTSPHHHFTDPFVERKDVIARFLQLIVHRTVGEDAFMRRQAGSLLDRILLTEYMDLIKFLDCWGCDEPLLEDNSRLRLSVSLIHACVSRTLNPLDIFVLGAEMDERNVCATAISAGCFADRVYDAATGEYRQVVWGVKQLPERFLQLCSAEYVDAVIRAIRDFWKVSSATPGGSNLPFDYLQNRFCAFQEYQDFAF